MFPRQELQELIDAGFISVQKHPSAGLYIYNYTPKAQYERLWNEITLQCRGLILDENMQVMARPFPKFFNLGELENQAIPGEPFEVFEKMDGSLGILYWIGDQPFIATRGSFTSEQSVKANEILHRKYAPVLHRLNRTYTYLFEIIYPSNRIVVNYHDMEDLVLLGVIDTQSGQEQDVEGHGFTPVKKYHGIADMTVLQNMQEENREGFVIRFAGGLRYKIKFEEYVRIHRIVTKVSNISIWEHLQSGEDLEPLLERVPDEFYHWVRKTAADLQQQYALIEQKARDEFRILNSRKETALYFNTCTYPKILFGMLDQRDYSRVIWKMLRPEFSRPFIQSEDTL